MALVDDIQALRDRVLAELTASHDYYVDTRLSWTIVKKVVQAGSKFTNRNKITGTVTSLAELAAKSKGYVDWQLTESTFQQFISIFEDFFFDLLRLWLVAYPRNLLGKKVDFKAILEAQDKDSIILFAVNKELNEILYERPTGWFAYLDDKVKLGCPTADEIDRIAEAKASRDVLVHNRGVASQTYTTKAGRCARFQVGEKLNIPEPYHRETWELIRKVVANISDAAIAKA